MDDASQVLRKIARGTGIVFVGTVISMFFGFLSRVVIARYLSPGEYGVFNLALTVLNIALVLATLGFQNSLPREVAFYRMRVPSKLRDLVSTALLITTLNSIFWTAVLIFGADRIAGFFNETRLLHALRVVPFVLPFWALTIVMISISRGFGRVREQVYFQNILYSMLFMLFVVVGAFLKLSLEFLFGAYVVAWVLTFIALTFEVWKRRVFEFGVSLDLKLGKDLVKFSIPLLLTGIAGFVMTWTDTLMLGYYHGSDVVGLYNGAAPVARLLSLFLNSAGLIFPPLATVLYTSTKIKELGRVYQVLTKWIFLATFPLFALMFLFPEATIHFFFGSKYLPAAHALRILAVGYMFHTLLGLNGWSLIVIRESNFVMYSTLVSAGINVVLNALLIPVYGIEGAAAATAASYFATNVLNSFRLYQKVKIHPFGKSYIKTLVVAISLLVLALAVDVGTFDTFYVFVTLAVIIGVFSILVIFSRSIDREDVDLLRAVEKQLGVDLGRIERVLKRFV